MSSYREMPEADPREDELVTVATYIDVVEAEMARADLSAIGVNAFVIEATGYNPLLSQMAGGIRLMVRDADAGVAAAHLEEQRRASSMSRPEEDDEADPDAVRCPRCELAYTSFEKPRLSSAGGASPLVLLFYPLVLLFGQKRYRCHKCFHVWDERDAGPKRLTPLGPDDPKPVFRLRRGSPGMGLFLGGTAGLLLAIVWPPFAFLLLAGGALLGWTIGRSITRDVCSEPQCRAPLAPDVTDCPSCHGTVAGVITRAHEHYSEAADVRRELAAAHAKAAKMKPKRAKVPTPLTE